MALALGVVSKGRTGAATSQVTAGVTTQAAGSAFVIGIGWDTGNFTSLVDSKGNTYTLINTELAWGLGSAKSRLYYCENGVGGASHTATVTVSASSPILIAFLEILGPATSGALDQSNRIEDVASPFTSPAITTTQAAEMLVSWIVGDSGSNPATLAESTGFTIPAGSLETNGASFYTGGLAYRIVAATSTYNSSHTQSGSNRAAVHIASFKELVGGGGTSILRQMMNYHGG